MDIKIFQKNLKKLFTNEKVYAIIKMQMIIIIVMEAVRLEVVRKNSRKRDAILEVIRSTTEHPNAEWIYSKVKPLYPELSFATVYRNIKVFVENGEIICVGTVNGQERYDGTTRPHIHFICNSCGRVMDVGLDGKEETLYARLENELGIKVLSHNLSFSGLCAECLEKHNN